ncbi:aminotransferase class III-fold pyridoxal phosphate-dependent enzyme [Fictibacillus sp. KIGAM418]|uniref:Aminotransferase class III-fold pyridoxal phosphate-dependent enzyme n=1 Tax=Fictibacillus marinisediminis TaxID=2878389 RepID=A0A9X1XEY8_9BACL|nr:aminotransferase class III-fold pyridoxal phosphate-dependent enzyme [Fictibacillus marinisediminis]MCK6259431.1 aminotransferase class III-fold pyridoxal phosphate-dependent enzyme [Fictibacillus marinisediminis]
MNKYNVLHPFSFMPNLQDKTEEDIKEIYTFLESGKGCWVKDDKGNEYFYATTAVPTVGLGNKRVVDAINKQMERLSFASTCGQTHPYVQKLAEKLVSVAGEQFSLCFYTTDGSGAIETAMKLARQHFMQKGLQGKSKFISFDGNYHGTTFASGSVTKMGIQETFGEGIKGCYTAPFPNMLRPPVEGTEEEITDYCLQRLKHLIAEISPDEVAAIIFEPIQGVNGIIPMSKRFLQQVASLAKENNILLIADEVTTGLGRTGYWTSSEYYGIKPDLLTISKGLTGGYFPMGATLISSEIESSLLEEGGIFLHGSTQCGHPVGCVAALELISIIEEENLLENAKEMGEYILSTFKNQLKDCKHIGEVRGEGLMISIEFVSDRLSNESIDFSLGERFSQELRRQGVLGNYFNGILLLYPPLNVSKSEATFLSDKVLQAINQIFGGMNENE